jgi:hypothetical protein
MLLLVPNRQWHFERRVCPVPRCIEVAAIKPD